MKKILVIIIIAFLSQYNIYAQHVCIDYKVEPIGNINSLALVAETGKNWAVGQNITVGFFPGASDFMKSQIIKYAKEWEKYANVHFIFIDNVEDAQIRISFDLTDGSWSYIGTDALSISSNKATMNFGWFNDNTTEEVFASTTLHEFGHALGLLHEHKHPEAGIQWDREAVISDYTNRPNPWSISKIEHNIFNHYSADKTQYSQYDNKSIMHYWIPSYWTTNGYSVDPNRELSEIDKSFVEKIYPKYNSSVRGGIAGVIDAESRMAHWSQNHFYEIGGKTYLFRHSSDFKQGNAGIHQINSDGTIGKFIKAYDWSWVWSEIHFYSIKGNLFLFQHSKDAKKNNMRIRKVNSDGTLGAVIQNEDWSWHWDKTDFFKVGNALYFYQHTKDGSKNNVRVRKVNSDGTLGDLVDKEDRTANWTQSHFYTINGNTYLFWHTKGNGKNNARVRKVNSNGSLGADIQNEDWSWHWDKTDFFKVGNALYFYQHTKDGSKNNVRIRKVNSDGTLGDLVDKEDRTANWTQSHFYTINGNTYLFWHTKGNGKNNARVRKVNTDGSLGADIQNENWSAYWSEIDFFKKGNDLYFFQHSKDFNTGNVRVRKINR